MSRMSSDNPSVFDLPLKALIASNAATLAIALFEGWSLAPLLLIYWVQNVVIGLFNVRRMLDLTSFTTDGLRMNGQPVDPVPRTKRNAASFFAAHYGAFHLAYLAVVLYAMSADETVTSFGLLGIFVGGVVFAINHWISYRENRELDSRGSPNIGTLMFLPYARIAPMHLVALLGTAIAGPSRLALVAFLGLKTLADAIMHIVEHRVRRATASVGLPR